MSFVLGALASVDQLDLLKRFDVRCLQWERLLVPLPALKDALLIAHFCLSFLLEVLL